MIVSTHHLTGFWFESALSTQPEGDRESASAFLTASLDALRADERGGGEYRGAINTGIDPARLNPGLPGYRWLQERLRWMKQTFPDFDDQPGGALKDHDKLRDPFPAFHWNIRYAVAGRPLALDGVRVLVGHDFVVVHEFCIRQEGEGGTSPPRGRRFAQPPESSHTLFTATFTQLPASDVGGCGDDWEEAEFARGSGYGVEESLRWAVRADQRHYRGCVLDDADGADQYARLKRHIEATGCYKSLCTLLANDSKVQYEYRIADRALEGLEHALHSRAEDAEELLRAWRSRGPQSFAKDSLDALGAAHLADRRSLDLFDQLVDNCQRNLKQFGQVASRLMKPDNRWAAGARPRMRHEIGNLLVAKRNLRRRFDTTAAFLDELRRMSQSAERPAAASPGGDAKVLGDLRERLQQQLLDCNEFCLTYAGFRLFKPSQETYVELFNNEIHIPVTSNRDFRSFIIMLHKVFDEGLPTQLRRWKPEREGGQPVENTCGTCGQRRPKPAKPPEPLPDPLTQVAEILHSDTFDQLSVLRNKFAAHDALQGDNAGKAQKKLAQVYENLIGKKKPPRYSASDWLELQKAVLQMLSQVLAEIEKVFDDYQNGAGKRALG